MRAFSQQRQRRRLIGRLACAFSNGTNPQQFSTAHAGQDVAGDFATLTALSERPDLLASAKRMHLKVEP